MQRCCFQKTKMKSPNKRIIHFLFLLFVFANAAAENSAKTWYFGQRVGLNFNQSPPAKLTDGAVTAIEGTASISDANGDLLFYTNGTSIVNKTHQIMQN